MVLRNVAKTFSLDEQRVEINEIAQDVDSLPNLGSFSVTTNSVGTAALSYDNSTGTFSYTPPDLSSYLTATAISNSGNWDAAYGWGDHSTQGYATESWVTAKSYLQNGVLASPLYRSGGDLVIIAGGPQTTRPHIHLKNSASSNLEILGSSVGSGGILLNSRGASNSVELQHNSVKVLETTSTGVSVSGNINSTGALTTGNITFPTGTGSSGQVLTSDGLGSVYWNTVATSSGGASVTTSDAAPTSASDGDLWWDSVNGILKIYYQDVDTSQWVDATPSVSGINLTDFTVNTAPTGSSSLTYDNTTGNFTYTPPDLSAYLTSESDPVFSASASAGITNSDISNWNTAYGWGNHATAGYLTALSIDLNNLNDVDLTTPPTTGQVLKYDGTNWIAGDDNSGGSSLTKYEEIGLESWTNSHNSSITFTQALDDPKGNGDQATWLRAYYNDIVVGSTTFPNATKTLVEVDTGGHNAISGTSADAIILQDATRTAFNSSAGSTAITSQTFQIVPSNGHVWTIDGTTYPVMGAIYVPTSLTGSVDLVVAFHGTLPDDDPDPAAVATQAGIGEQALAFLNNVLIDQNKLNLRDKIVFSAAIPQDHISKVRQYNLDGVGKEETTFLMGDNLPYARAAVAWGQNSISSWLLGTHNITVNRANTYIFGHSQGGALAAKINTLQTYYGVVANSPGPIQFDLACTADPANDSCAKVAVIHGPAGSSGGIQLTDISSTTLPVVSGVGGALSYNSSTGVISYTPPDLSPYATPSDIPQNIGELQDVSSSSPSTGQVLKWDGSQWAPGTDLTTSGGSGITLSDISVTTNTAGTPALSYNNTTGVFSYTPPTLLQNIVDSAQGVDVTGRVAAEGLNLSTGGQINAAGCSIDFQSSLISFSGASISGLSGEIRDNVDLHLNQTDGTNVLPSDGQVLSWNATGGGAGTGDYEWVDQSGGSTYSNSDVDSHLNISNASAGKVLAWNGSDYTWINQSSGGGGSSSTGLLTSQPASGSEVIFAGIPANATEITVMLGEVGLTDTSQHLLVQLGTASGWISSGYYASSEAENGTYDVSSSSGFPIHNRNSVTSTGNRFTGSMIINLLQTSPSRVYTQIGQFHRWSSLSDGTDVGSSCQSFGDVKSISSEAEITRVRVLANNSGGSQTFTTGIINISYKTASSSSSGGNSGIALTDLSVTTNSPGTAGLSYNDSSGVFSYTPPQLTVSSLTDVSYSVIDTGSVLTYNGSGWTALGVPRVLGQLNNVSSSAPSDGDVLTWNSSLSTWQPAAPTTGGSTGSGTTHDWANGVEASGWAASDLSNYMFNGGLNTFAKAETSGTDYLGWDNSANGANLPVLNGPVEIFIRYADVGNYTYEVNGVSVTPDLTGVDTNGDWITLTSGTAGSFRVTAPSTSVNVSIAAVKSNGLVLTPTALYGGSTGGGDTFNLDANLNTPSASAGEILSWNGTDYEWVADQTGSSGIALTDLSVVTNSAGTAALTYNDSSGQFSYTPPDLSGYSTFSGSYNDLSNKPTIPTATSQLTNDSGFITSAPSVNNIDLPDASGSFASGEGYATFGDSDDLQIYYDGTNDRSKITSLNKLDIRGSEIYLWDGTDTFISTLSTGVRINHTNDPDNTPLRFLTYDGGTNLYRDLNVRDASGNFVFGVDTSNDATLTEGDAFVTGTVKIGGSDPIIAGRGNSQVASNTAFGAYALNANTATGTENTSVGYYSMSNNTSGKQNTGIGVSALGSTTIGDANTTLGYAAAYTNVGGSKLTAIGAYSQRYADSSDAAIDKTNVSVGFNSLKGSVNPASNTGNDNTAIGTYALQGTTSGDGNTALGTGTLYNNTEANYNTAIGYYSLFNATTGANNIAVGKQALYNLNTGEGNIAIGFETAAQTTTGLGNIAIGNDALKINTEGSWNIAIGYQALEGQGQFIFQNNVAIGTQALQTCFSDQNVAVGPYALANLSGPPEGGPGWNTAVGYAANGGSSGVGNNTAIGAYAGYYGWNGTAQTQNPNHQNVTNLGFNSSCSGSDQVNLGATLTTTYAWGAVQNRSDERDKADIRDTTLGLDFIKSLRPVDFRWDYRDDYFDYDPETNERTAVTKDGSRKRNRYHHGLIAQEVKSASDSLGIDFAGYQDHKVNGGGDVLSIGYTELIAPIIKAMQELAAENAQLKARLDAAGL